MQRRFRELPARKPGRLVRLSEHRKRRRPRRSPAASAWLPWRKFGILAILAAAVIGGREWAVAAHGVLSGKAECEIGRVVDGDTLKVWCPGRGMFSARLAGFDTPEVFSPRCLSEFLLGTRATWALRQRIWRADEVRMVFSGFDRYERRLTWLFLDGTDVARPMVEDGLARPYDGGPRGSWCG